MSDKTDIPVFWKTTPEEVKLINAEFEITTDPPIGQKLCPCGSGFLNSVCHCGERFDDLDF